MTDDDSIALPVAGMQCVTPGTMIRQIAGRSFSQCQQPSPDAPETYIGGWRDRRIGSQGLNPRCCARAARYQVGSYRLCRLHAGSLLLDLALQMHPATIPGSDETPADTAPARAELTPFQALMLAVELAGSIAQFAGIFGKSEAEVWKWLQSSKRLPSEYVLRVEAATGISRHLLRPDIYPLEHGAASPTLPDVATQAAPVSCGPPPFSHARGRA